MAERFGELTIEEDDERAPPPTITLSQSSFASGAFVPPSVTRRTLFFKSPRLVVGVQINIAALIGDLSGEPR